MKNFTGTRVGKLLNSYFVDDTNGSDLQDGLSPETAWQSIEKVNATTFLPGDRILFKAGGIWTGTLHPLGSGDENSQIVIDQYNIGDKPLIQGAGGVAGVMLESQEYWTIRNLAVTNEAEERAIRQGIYIYGKDDGITHRIIIQDCEVYNVTGENRRNMDTYYSMYWNSGIYISIPGRSNSSVHYDEVLVENNYVHDVLTSGIRINQREDFIVDQYHTNVVIRNNVIRRTGSDGMIVANCVAPLAEYNLCYDAGALGTTSETLIIAGLWTCGSSDAMFQHNEVARTILFESDGTAFDTDWGVAGVTTFQYNYTHGNQGGFWLDCAGINYDPNYEKTICRYNVSADDERYLVRAGDLPAEFYNNTFYRSSGTLDACFENAGSQHTFWNNIFHFPLTPDWASSVFENNLYYPCAPCPSDSSPVLDDPKLVDPLPPEDGRSFADHYKIGAGSAAINQAATIVDNGGKDFWGVVLDDSPDIGACETRTPSDEQTDTYVFARGFSTTQGKNNWYYLQGNGSAYSELSWNTQLQQWQGDYRYTLIWDVANMHPDTNDTVLGWQAEKAGQVQVTGIPRKSGFGGDGVNLKIMHNDTQIWPESDWQYLGPNDGEGIRHDVKVTVEAEDRIYFIVNQYGTNANDAVAWNPTISYIISESYNLTQDFSAEQGTSGWYYLESDGVSYSEMVWNAETNRWNGSNTYSLIWAPAQLHPDGLDTVVGWKAPNSGTVLVLGNPKKAALGYDGVKVKIKRNDQQIWPENNQWQNIAGDDALGYLHRFTLEISEGDMLYFIVNQNGDNSADETYWSPTIIYV